MDTVENIHNALEWANKRLELQGEALSVIQRNYIVFALSQQLPMSSNHNMLCTKFEPSNNTSTVTHCKCGHEKWKHPKQK